jgi:hypothetical protein
MSGRLAIGLFDVEKEQLSLRRGLLGLVAILVALAFVGVFGYVGVAALLGALVTAAAAGVGRRRVRVTRASAVAVLGSLLTLVGVWSGERGWTAAVVIGLVAFAATLASAYGKEAATSSYLLTLWVLLSLTFTASDHSSAGLAANFLAGGAVAALLQPVLGRTSSAGDARPATAGRPTDRLAPLRAALRPDSPLSWFALVRAGAIAGATLLGYCLFDAHPYWAAFVAFAVTKSDPAELVAAGVHRAVGTIAGAAVAVELVRNVDSRPWLTGALVVASMLAVTFSKANYAVFTFFMTAVIVLSTQLVRGDAELAAGQRTWATLLGVGLAFATTALVLLAARRRAAGGARPTRRSDSTA